MAKSRTKPKECHGILSLNINLYGEFFLPRIFFSFVSGVWASVFLFSIVSFRQQSHFCSVKLNMCLIKKNQTLLFNFQPVLCCYCCFSSVELYPTGVMLTRSENWAFILCRHCYYRLLQSTEKTKKTLKLPRDIIFTPF